MDKIGTELKANHDRFNAVSEAFGAAKEVKLGSLEDIYLKDFLSRHKFLPIIKQQPKLLLKFQDLH